MMAGAAAGIMEHSVMYPFDVVKTRMQSLHPVPGSEYRSIMEALSRMVRNEGYLRPIRGINAMVVGAGPAHALYFSTYEKLKRVFSGTEHGSDSPLSHAAAGALSTLLHDGIMVPAEVVKQRLQMYNSPYKGVFDCAAKVWRTEGPRAFYRSYTTQMAMNIPFQSIHFMAYEYMQNVTNRERKFNPKAHILSGAFAGAFAAAVTTPLDVCKTLLNTQEERTLAITNRTHISGMVTALATVYRIRGLQGYFYGLKARVLFQMPATAISWCVYETFKFMLQKNKE